MQLVAGLTVRQIRGGLKHFISLSFFILGITTTHIILDPGMLPIIFNILCTVIQSLRHNLSREWLT